MDQARRIVAGRLMRIIPLSEWYPAMDRLWLREGRRLSVPIAHRKGYVVHHTDGGVGQDELGYARAVADMHFQKWSRPGGYNFQIGNRGTIFEMCGWEYVGAHAPGCNYSKIGVSFQGNFAHRLPNQTMLDAFGWLVATHPVPNVQQGHRDCSSTSCPGDELYDHLPLEVRIPDPPKPPDPEEIDFMADPEIAKALHRLADAQQVRNQVEVAREVAAIRDRAGKPVDPASDAVWVKRIVLDGTHGIADAAEALG